ncbi:MAG TPA: molybdate ABC transporter substrate-binding protein [Geobacteraceae bacterium]|nr:molybdate ABC transporter substrate-binding protein [Geobacteraceae bacterium]
MLKRLLFTALFLLFALPSHAGEVRLSAAASLREAVDEICARYAQAHKGDTVLTNYGASGMLAKQVDNGAPADIFISASDEWLDYLKAKGRLDPVSIGTFAYNSLVFAGRGDRKAAGMRDLPALSRIAIGSPKSVPAGEYAMEAMRKAGIAGQLEKKLVPARDVREALMYAERGEVDGAFVYRTDALQGKRVKILFTVPPELYRRISYPMALTVAGARNGPAAEFYRYLRSGEAHAILGKYGFEVR